MSNNPGCESAVRARVAAAWKKWREIASLLVNRKIPLECRTKNIWSLYKTSDSSWGRIMGPYKEA